MSNISIYNFFEDENGKSQLMWFSVLINRTTDVVKVNIDEDEDVQSPF